jgi:hypothetical protein
MGRINVWLVAVCLFLTTNIYAQSEASKLKSSEVFAYSQKIAEAAKDQIWTDFDARRYASLKSETDSNYINFTSEPDNPNAQFFWQLSDEYFTNHNLEENLLITFHEAFHGFERDPKRAGGKWRAENSLLVFEYAETSARNNALFNIEARILYAALQTGKTSELKQKVRQFLAVRKLRQSEFEPRFAEFEKGAESNEGLAEYAGTKAVIIGIEGARRKQFSIPFSFTDSRAYLLEKYEKLDSITNIGRNIRLKFYYTGSAQAFLLDRLLPDWKAKVQMENASLQELLETSVGTKTQTPEKEIKAALRRYDYEKLLESEEKAVAERKSQNQALLNSILTQKGRRVVIDYSALSQSVQIRSFDPMNVTMITPKMRVHTRMVKFAANDFFTADFSQPVVEDLDNKRYITVVPENEIQSVTADGEIFEFTKTAEKRFEKSLVINSAKFKLEARGGTIRTENGEIIVKLSK